MLGKKLEDMTLAELRALINARPHTTNTSRYKTPQEYIDYIKSRDLYKRDETPPRKRPLTKDELNDLLIEDVDKVPLLQKKGVKERSFDLDRLQQIAKKISIPLERDRTPERGKSEADKAIHDFNAKIKKERERKAKYSALNKSASYRESAAPYVGNDPSDSSTETNRERTPLTRREEERSSAQPLLMQRSVSNPVGILKSQKPKGSLLETINSIRSNPEEIFQERTRAVTGTGRPDRVRSKSQVRFDRDRMNADTRMWAHPPQQYEDEPIQELPVPDTAVRKGILDRNMKLPAVADSTDTKFGLPWEQQVRKGVAEAAMHVASKPYQPYLKPTVADLSEGERRAEQMSAYMSPFTNEQLQNEENDIEDRILDAGEMPGSVEAANPYMKAFDQNPADMHEELMGPMERAQLESIREESDRNLNEKLLPELKRKYLVPGMKRSGHMNKEVGDLIEKYSKGREHAINQAMTQNRLGTLGVAQKHMSLQGNAAQQSARNAQDDVTKQRGTADMLFKAQLARNDARKNTIAETERYGVKHHDVRQKMMKADQAAFEEAKQHEGKEIGILAAINSGLGTQGFYGESKLNQLRENPASGQNNLATNFGNSLASMAQEGMPRRKAKGGLIKSRCKRAAGGQIMQEAVKNAVIDKDDPLTALRRLMNRQRMMDVSESNIGRRRYRDGGSVNPIQAGASQARELLGEKDLRAHIASHRTSQEDPTGTRMVDAFMRGFGSEKRTDGLAGMANAYNDSAKVTKDRNEKDYARKDKAFRDTYALDKDVRKEEAALRKEAREEKKMLADQAYRNAHLAQIGAYQTAKLKKGEKALSDVKKDALKLELKDKLDKAIYKRDTALNLNAATKGIDTGRWVGGAAKIPYIGHGVASALTGFSSSPMELQAADDASEEFFSARKPTQGRETNIQTADRRKAKAGLDKGEKFNSNQTRNLAKTDQSEVNTLLTEYAKYADPHELKDYVNQYRDPQELANSLNPETSKKVDKTALISSLKADEAELARLESEG